MSSISFLPLAAKPEDYPKPCLSVLSTQCNISRNSNALLCINSAFLNRHQSYVYGRYALVEALRRAGVGPGNAVLVPAYHCRTMVDSALYLGAKVRFYPTTDKLRPNFAAMQTLVADGTVSAMLLTHYFGFPNALMEARTFCSQAGIALVEDCAHAFYGEDAGVTLGTVGDYAIASTWKFLPVRGGAVLRDNANNALPYSLTGQPILAEFKAIAAHVLQHAGRRQPRPNANIEDIVARVFEISNQPSSSTSHNAEPAGFNPDFVNMAGLRVSRWITAYYPHAYAIQRRRANYQRWLEGVEGVPGIHPLFPKLPDGVVPYVFPLLADEKGLAFHALRLAGIPIWRWEDMAVDAVAICPNACALRLRLLQLPCHQDLTEQEMDWMIDIVHQLLPRVIR